MANPQISKHIHHFPEDSGQYLEQCWQAQHWLRDINPALATPMVHVGHQDYYVFEPAKLCDGTVIIPEQWFTRKIHGKDVYFAKAWCTHHVAGINGWSGYVVLEYDSLEVSMHEFLLSMPQLVHTYKSDNLPDPREIIGKYFLLTMLPRRY